ncbi:Nudix family hydrolase [Schizosaccharomyces pombe]
MELELDLLTGLQLLSEYCPRVTPNAPPRRASVAVIIAFKESQDFSNPKWPQCIPITSVPYVLLIQRSFRDTDRWSGHMALPGGTRSLTDKSDIQTAHRETLEEVGIDLRKEHAHFVGALDERVITSNWGQFPLLLLSSFVFILPYMPSLRLQESEVFSAQWYPLADLLLPECQTRIQIDSSRALKKTYPRFIKTLFHLAVGNLMYSAIRLEFDPSSATYSLPPYQRPFLWGITHSIFVDLFIFLSPSSARHCFACIKYIHGGIGYSHVLMVIIPI